MELEVVIFGFIILAAVICVWFWVARLEERINEMDMHKPDFLDIKQNALNWKRLKELAGED